MEAKKPNQPKTKSADDLKWDQAMLEVLLIRAIKERQWGMAVFYQAIIQNQVDMA